MRFRVAAVQDAGLPQSLTDARLLLEDWLNRTLQDGDFGLPQGCIMIVIFAVSELPIPPASSRLISRASEGTTLALHIVVDPTVIEAADPSSHLQLISSEIVRKLPAKPLRKPKTLDYPRLRQALTSCIQPFAASEA